MSYVTTGPFAREGGVLEYVITETSPGASDDWEIDLSGTGVEFGHTVLVLADVMAGTGTVQPLIGTLETLVADEEGFVLQADAAAANVRIGEYRNFMADLGKLWGKSQRTGTPTTVRTRVFLRAGAAT